MRNNKIYRTKTLKQFFILHELICNQEEDFEQEEIDEDEYYSDELLQEEIGDYVFVDNEDDP